MTELTPVCVGDIVLVSGPGPIGMLAVKLLVAEGVKTIVAGVTGDGERLSAAKRYGAAADSGQGELAAVIAEEANREGVDVAFECAGQPSSVRNCTAALAQWENCYLRRTNKISY